MPDTTARLRAALEDADYTVARVEEVLGVTAYAALGRSETTPGLRATTGLSPVETMIRLWLLQTPVPLAAAERALPGLVDRLCAASILERSAGEVLAGVDLRPHEADGRAIWVASDRTPGLDGAGTRVGPDHVLGISPSALSLVNLTARTRCGRALDLGTGCGIQALHLAGHATQVVATDVSPRALWLTGLNVGLNELAATVRTREGSLFEPVVGEHFDLIVSNPPFVISPPGGERLVYRDSGIPGDETVERIVRAAPSHLAEGGTAQLLASWMAKRDQPWEERVAAWLDPDCAAWVVQRDTLDLAAYVELWLKDAGIHPSTGGDPTHYRDRYDAWLTWLEEQGAEAIGFGWINLRAPGGRAEGPGGRAQADGGRAQADGGRAQSRLEAWPWDIEQPIGAEVAAHFERVLALRSISDDALLASRLRLRPDVLQETVGPVGAEDPRAITLRQQRGMRRARRVDTVEAALAGSCDGDLTVAQILAALVQILGPDLVGDPTGTRLGAVRSLVEDGFLEVAP